VKTPVLQRDGSPTWTFDVVGTFKAAGLGLFWIVLAEAVTLSVVAAAIGIALATWILPIARNAVRVEVQMPQTVAPLKQMFAVLEVSLISIRQRWVAALVTVTGITSVVAVLVSMLSMGVGARRMADQGVRDDRAVVTSKGAQSPFNSNLPQSVVGIVENAPGVKKGEDGEPLLGTQTAYFVPMFKKRDHVRTQSALFGVNPGLLKVFPEIHLIAGRMFTRGVHEVIIATSRYEQFEHMEIGDKVRVHGSEWTIVGRFAAEGGAFDSALLTDNSTLASAVGGSEIQSIFVILDSPQHFERFQASLQSNPAINVDVKRQAEWAQIYAEAVGGIMDFLSYFVGSVMAIGASLGAINVMYSVVDSRRRYIATLRAIGFRSGSILAAVLLESLLLAIPGALLGSLIAWAWFNGSVVSPSGISVRMSVTAHLISMGIAWALAIGLIGGIFPAVRAARVPVATALRAS